VGSTTACPVHNFTPPSELLVCYQPYRQKVVPGQKSVYETFLVGRQAVLSDNTTHQCDNETRTQVTLQINITFSILMLKIGDQGQIKKIIKRRLSEVEKDEIWQKFYSLLDPAQMTFNLKNDEI
jgi:hypothetical protein